MNLKKAAKKFIKIVFRVIVLPLYLLFRLFAFLGNKDGVFQSFSQLFSLIPGKIGIYIRAAFYHMACPNTSDNISIGFLTILSHQNTTIHDGVYIGPQCNIGKCSIEKNTLLGSSVHILSGNKQHDFSDLNSPIQEQGGQYQKIHIGDDCWIGNGSIVMSHIPSKVIVAAGSVITKTPKTGDIIAGNPSKIIRNRLDTKIKRESYP